eukprot:g9976.t1
MNNKKKRLGIFENIAPATPTKKAYRHDNTRNIQQFRPPPGFEDEPQRNITRITNVNSSSGQAQAVNRSQRQNDQAVPEAFLCQLSKQLMKNPVCISNGEMFESNVARNCYYRRFPSFPVLLTHSRTCGRCARS